MVVIVSDYKNGSMVGQYGIHLISSHFGILIEVVLQCLVWDFEYTNANILDVNASIVGIL
jgi:hypothetical protein